MRTALLLLLVAAVTTAGESDVRDLVKRLSSDDYLAKLDARAQLLRMGRDIHPLLDSIEAPDPETARLLRGLTRTSKVLRLVVSGVPKRVPLGSHLTLTASLINDSPHAYRMRFAPSGDGPGTDAVALSIRFQVEGGDQVVPPDSAIGTHGTPTGSGRWLTLPGDKLTFKVFLFGHASPAQSDARTRMRLVLEGGAARLLDDPRQGGRMADPERIESAPVHLVIASPEHEIEWVARPAAELDAILRSDDRDAWRSVQQELTVRDAAEILPLLRRHANHPEIRLIAVRRLGQNADETDLDLIREATRDTKRAVQLAAIEALGRYRSPKARRRLLLHVYDYGLRDESIRALTHHKHPATINCFIHLLKTNVRDGAWVRMVQDCLEQWTGLRVENRPDEIRRFERWWIENRDAWIRENVSDS